ncbi:hypothetical protein [Blastococcus sp. SYSU D00695]
MSELEPRRTAATPVPDAMPVLSRGQHTNPSRGACFMEYTSLLAGEPFSDRPRCVDAELGDVLRSANDRLSDADRPLLVPLLGRAIGLVVEPPPPGPRGLRRGALRHRREVLAPHRERTATLRRAATRRFVATVGPARSLGAGTWSGRSGALSQLFWDSMAEPASPATPRAYARRLVERLTVLHECFERAMDDLGLAHPATPPVARGPVATTDSPGELVPAPRRPREE